MTIGVDFLQAECLHVTRLAMLELK